MKRSIVVAAVLLLLPLGCATTQFSKEVVVTKDGSGKVVSVVVKESVVQPEGVAEPMVLEYIHLVPVNARSNSPTPVDVPKN